VADALQSAFALYAEVEVKCADLLVEAHDTVVSPANSAGFMDGGIDAASVLAFGPSIETELRRRLSPLAGGLSVGASLCLPVQHERVQRIIVAPTMDHPDSVPAINARRAMAAILRRATDENVRHLYCPGLCTGVGQVDPADAAEQMRLAFERWASRQDSTEQR
jgi:O-acetyl-ADP-ribose deacetylase (regulator of RNase III)